MQVKHLTIFLSGLAGALTQAPLFADTALLAMDEPQIQLSAPVDAVPAISTWHIDFVTQTGTLVTDTPLLCGNTASASTPTAVNAVYYSDKGRVGTSPLPFVFGSSSATPSISAVAYGATNFSYNGTAQFGGDPLDALVCYGLDANGVHKLTRDLFFDGFNEPAADGLIGNSTVSVSVFHLPAGAPNNYYGYTVDVTIPSLPNGTNCTALDCNFALTEGFDSSVFDPNQGGWCMAGAGAQSCPGSLVQGGININYANYGTTTSLAAPVGAGQPLQAHFVVFRYFRSGVVSLPGTGAPVVMAALFSPIDLLENKLDDNVATGNNTLANLAPIVSNSAALGSALLSLHENSPSGSMSFDISDADTIESSGNLTQATVSLNLPNGIQVPIVANCGATTPITTLPVNRSCSIDIALDNPTFWDASVAAQYQGQFNNVATDASDGNYASGVGASVQIVVVDAAGKSSAAVNLPVHVFSTKNDAPVVTFDANQLADMPDPNDSNNSYPTYSCSIGAGNCGATFNIVTLNSSVAALAGPAAAFDEVAAQTTAANDLQCGADGGATPVAFANAPVVAPHLASPTQYDIAFQFATPLAATSSLCTLTMTDAQLGGFPNSEPAATTNSTFRIVVNP